MDAKKALVRACYDRTADAFAVENRQRPTAYPDDARRERAWFERLVATLPPAARVVDVGCGSGEPYLVALAARPADRRAVRDAFELARARAASTQRYSYGCAAACVPAAWRS